MKKGKKRIFIVLLAVLSACCLIAGCNEKKEITYTFDSDVTTMEAELGGIVLLPEIKLKGSDNSSVDTTLTVYDGDNAEVKVTNMQFVAEKVSGYTVKYTAVIEGKPYEHTITVTVKDNTAPAIEVGKDDYLVRVNSTFTIPQITATDAGGDASVSYEVKFGETTVDVTEGAFLVDQEGKYVITVTAEDESGNKATKVINVYAQPENVLYDASLCDDVSLFQPTNMTVQYNDEGYAEISSAVTWPKFTLAAEQDLTEYKYIYFDMKIEENSNSPYVDATYIGLGTNESFKDYIVTGEWFRWYIPIGSRASLSDWTFQIRRNDGVEIDGGWVAVNSTIQIKKVGIEKAEVFDDTAFDGSFDQMNDAKYFTSDGNFVAYNDNEAYSVSGGSVVMMSYNRWPFFTFDQSILDTMEEEGYIALSFKAMVSGADLANIDMTEGLWGNVAADLKLNEWKEYTVPLATLQSAAASGKLGLQINLKAPGYVLIYLDDFQFVYEKPENVILNEKAKIEIATDFATTTGKEMTAEYEENYLVVSSTVTWPEFKLNLSVDTSEYYLMYIDMKVEAGTLASGEYLGFGYNNTFKDKIKTGEWFRFYIPVSALKTTFSENIFQLRRNNGDWTAVNASLYISEMGLIKAAAVDASVAFSGNLTENDTQYFTSTGNVVFYNTDSKYTADDKGGSVAMMSFNRWPQLKFDASIADYMEENGYTSLKFKMFVESAGADATAKEGMGTVTEFKCNEWIDVEITLDAFNTAIAAGTNHVQVNMPDACQVVIYIDAFTFVGA